MQFNCNGLRNKVADITNFTYNNNIKIATIQETKLLRECPITSAGIYNIVRKDRERNNGGGLASILERTVKYKMTNTPAFLNPDVFLKVMFIMVKTEDTDINITNVYIPPVNIIGTYYHLSMSSWVIAKLYLVISTHITTTSIPYSRAINMALR